MICSCSKHTNTLQVTITILFKYCCKPSNSMEDSLSEANSSAITKFPACYGSRFITVLTIAHHLPLSNIKLMHSTATLLRYILILSYHLGLGLQSGHFPSHFPIKLLCAFLFPMHATNPTHLIFFALITQVTLGGQYIS